MTKEMTFNGVDMSRFFRIKDIIRPIGNKRSVSTDNAPLLGVNIQQVKRGEKEHIIKFDIKTTNAIEMEQLKHDLAGVLNVLEPVKITYGDEPDKYYMGLPVDEITPENLTRWFQRSELKIIIPDGVAHSSTYRKFDSEIDARQTSDKMLFTLTNNGTTPAFPIVTVKHNSENGYVGLVNTSGALEVGDREEADIGIVKKSEILLDFRGDKITDGFARATKNRTVTNDNGENVVGTSEVTTVWNKKHIRLRDQTTQGKYGNYATGVSWDIPVDSAGELGSLNDYIYGKQIFIADSVAQYGFVKITVSDLQGRFLYGFETFKRTRGLECEFNIFASDGKNSYNFLKWWTFTGGSDSKQNPFTSTTGQFELRRNNDKLQVYYRGSYYSFVIPEIKDRKSARVHVMLGAYYDKPMVSNMYLNELLYRKDFVPTVGDVPNRYPIGSNIILNSENDTVIVDGIDKISDIVDGSKFLTIPPGESQLEVYVSSFVKNKPTVKVEFEERWL